MGIYLLDTNVLITAAKQNYVMDVFPGWWDWLKECLADSVVKLPRAVFDEIKPGDNLYVWIKTMEEKHSFVVEPDSFTTQHFSQIATYVAENYVQHQSSKFLDVGDPWLVAEGMKFSGATIITYEKSRKQHRHGVTKKIQGPVKIPNVCDEFSVPHQTLIEMMRHLKVKLHV